MDTAIAPGGEFAPPPHETSSPRLGVNGDAKERFSLHDHLPRYWRSIVDEYDGKVQWSFHRTLVARTFPLDVARKIDETLFGNIVSFAVYQSLNVLCIIGAWLTLFDVIPSELAFAVAMLYVVITLAWMACQHDLGILRNLVRHDLYVIGNLVLSTTAGAALAFIFNSGWRGAAVAVTIGFAGVPTVTIDCQCDNMRKDAFYWMFATSLMLWVLIILVNLGIFPGQLPSVIFFSIHVGKFPIAIEAYSIFNQAAFGLAVLCVNDAVLRFRNDSLRVGVRLSGKNDPSSAGTYRDHLYHSASEQRWRSRWGAR